MDREHLNKTVVSGSQFAGRLGLLVMWFTVSVALAASKPRARDLGIRFEGKPGVLNAITDVEGVMVGHATLIEGEGKLVVGQGPVRTGVTAVLPTGRKYRPVFAATASLNGNGEMTGTAWIAESGFLEEPVLLTNTRSVGVVHDAVTDWRAANDYHDSPGGFGWAALPVVAETWDGRLNDIHGSHVKRSDVFSALNGAASGKVAEGNVGGGTGMVCHRFKGGVGTSSRLVMEEFTLGVLVQANYGTRESLTIAGVPVGREIDDLMPVIHSLEPGFGGNSIVAVVATDAPLLPHQLKRLARRVSLGVGRTGGVGQNSSGDFFLAFSTAPVGPADGSGIRAVRMLENDKIDALFEATVQATEEAIINALIAAETMVGINGNTVYAIPHQRLRALMERYGR